MNTSFSKVALLAAMASCGVMRGCWTPAVRAQNGHLPTANSPAKTAGAEPAPGEPSGAPLLRGQQLLLDAKRRTEAHITITSQLRIRVQLMGQPLVGSGEYAQLRSSQGLLLRLEVAIQAGGQATRVKQVSDGRHLWIHRRVGETDSLSHIDLLRIQRALADSQGIHELAAPASSLASGGLPNLLARLAERFDFDRLPLRRGQLSDVPVWIATGVWKPQTLASLAPEAVAGDQIAFEKLPEHLPHRVEVQLGQRDLFPYKLTYQRWEDKDGRPRVVPAVTTEFFEVALGEELDARQFHYDRPTNVSVVDETHLYFRSISASSAKRRTGDYR